MLLMVMVKERLGLGSNEVLAVALLKEGDLRRFVDPGIRLVYRFGGDVHLRDLNRVHDARRLKTTNGICYKYFL